MIIDGIEYVPKDASGDVKIVVLQRGWVAVGRFSQDGERCQLADASIIRTWGTSKGLGEIALNGPTSKTVLDAAGLIEFHVMTTVLVLSCEESKWASRL